MTRERDQLKDVKSHDDVNDKLIVFICVMLCQSACALRQEKNCS